MKAIYLRTRLSVDQCRRRLAARTGPARLRQKFMFFGWRFGYAGERPLCGQVDAVGFDVFETPEEIGFPDVRVRGAWARAHSGTLLKFRPRRTLAGGRGFFLVSVVTLLVLFVLYGIASDSWFAAIILAGFFFVLSLLRSTIQWFRTGSEGRRFAERFAVLFEANRIDNPFEIMEACEALRRARPEAAPDGG